MALICISFMVNDVEHHFMCVLAIFMSSLEKKIFMSLACVSTGLLFFLI